VSTPTTQEKKKIQTRKNLNTTNKNKTHTQKNKKQTTTTKQQQAKQTTTAATTDNQCLVFQRQQCRSMSIGERGPCLWTPTTRANITHMLNGADTVNSGSR